MWLTRAVVLASLLAAWTVSAAENETASPAQFNPFVKRQAAVLRQGDEPPQSRDEWEHRRALLKTRLTAAWGGFPEESCDLMPRQLDVVQRDGYRIEKLIFQTRPGVWMTANAYVPDKPGRLPAILNVHGHWKGAKQDPAVQARCIAAAKLGFFALAVDAFGAGERGLGKKLGEYHGEMVAATLLPVGLPLSGLQVYENRRAVDYLLTRPDVDPDRIGITGASGGGNQTMYAGAMDERITCVVPTCSVGSYQSYLSAACCLCEVVPGALTFTEEGEVLGLAAHRGLMITSATRDAFQFSVDESRPSIARAKTIAGLYQGAEVRQTIIDSGHDYNKPMREAMLGWMTKHLKGEGDGSPVQEPEIITEDPEVLRCFPDDSRPDDFVTLPQFAASVANKLLAKRRFPADTMEWDAQRQHGLTSLEEVLGGLPETTPLNLKSKRDDDLKLETISFEPEPGLTLVLKRNVVDSPARVAVLLDLDTDSDSVFSGKLSSQLQANGWMVVAADLRATGRNAIKGDQIGGAPDHNSAEWSLWIGRPLLGQWTWDVLRILDTLKEQDGVLPKEIVVVGNRSAGLVALCSAAVDERISKVVTMQSLATYVTDRPYVGQRLGLMAPAILREVGDVAHLAALIAPRPVIIAGGVTGDGRILGTTALQDQFQFTAKVFSMRTEEPMSPFQIVAPEEVIGLLP